MSCSHIIYSCADALCTRTYSCLYRSLAVKCKATKKMEKSVWQQSKRKNNFLKKCSKFVSAHKKLNHFFPSSIRVPLIPPRMRVIDCFGFGSSKRRQWKLLSMKQKRERERRTQIVSTLRFIGKHNVFNDVYEYRKRWIWWREKTE